MEIMFFNNGNTVIFENNEQARSLQIGWIELYIEHLIKNRIDPALIDYIMPDGKSANVFKTESGYNWRIKK